MKRILLFTCLAAAMALVSCKQQPVAPAEEPAAEEGLAIKPITGSWVNFAWKDVRNKYTNPTDTFMDGPEVWETKVGEWHKMGLEYLIIMEVANEQQAYYPSDIMPRLFPEGEKSPVEALLDAAAEYDMKVFLSTGWAVNQFEDVREPAIQERQKVMMEELTALYKDKPAFYGWYLPVEDDMKPVFPATAVEAVNRLVEQSHRLTPGKKTLISPYGLVGVDFDDPEMATNIRNLKVDIIAYQDEVGCVREPFPLRRLKENWKKLRAIHDGTDIEMWANCETFTWQNKTNNLESALIPAAYARLLSQQIAATEGGVSTIVSFMFGGIIEDPSSPYRLGHGDASVRLWSDYMAWREGCPYWKMTEKSLRGTLCSGVQPVSATEPRLIDGVLAEQEPDEEKWVCFAPGEHSIELALPEETTVERLYVRCLDLARLDYLPPFRISVYNEKGQLLGIKLFDPFGNNRHDAWIDGLDIPCNTARTASKLVLAFTTEHTVAIDEIYVNP